MLKNLIIYKYYTNYKKKIDKIYNKNTFKLFHNNNYKMESHINE